MSSDQQGNLGCTLYAEDAALVYSAGLSALSYRESCVSYLKKAVSYSRPSMASPFVNACVESAIAAKAVTSLMDSFEGSLRQVIVSCYVRALLRMRFREESTVSSGAIVRDIPSILRVKDKSVVAGSQRTEPDTFASPLTQRMDAPIIALLPNTGYQVRTCMRGNVYGHLTE